MVGSNTEYVAAALNRDESLSKQNLAPRKIRPGSRRLFHQGLWISRITGSTGAIQALHSQSVIELQCDRVFNPRVGDVPDEPQS
jgi:hypothetical protein